jgi:hypothetical protein
MLIHFFRGESLIFDVERSDMVNCVLKLSSESLLAAFTTVVGDIERYEFRPWKLLLGLRGWT